MSYWHTCPGCAAQTGRRRYEDPDNLLMCSNCKESRVYAIAYQEGAERALLVRDVADVEQALRDPEDLAGLTGFQQWDCDDWLARARAVLG